MTYLQFGIRTILCMHEHECGLPEFNFDKIEMLCQSFKNTDPSSVLMTQDTNISYDTFF